MKTLIIFASKNGATEKAAHQIANKMTHDTKVINVKKMTPQLLAEYDNIVLGTSIYIGKIRREMDKFVNLNQANLQTKPLSIFLICGMKDQAVFESNFPDKLIEHAEFTGFLGHEYRLEKMNPIEKWIIKRAVDADTIKSACLDNQAILDFAKHVDSIEVEPLF